MKKIIIALVFICIGINIYIPLAINKRNTIINKETDDLRTYNDSLVKIIDSLRGEIFTEQIQKQRYEYILDRAEEEMSPECEKQLEKIYGETE